MAQHYPFVWNNLVTTLGTYLTDNHLETMVLGISGGIDSTVVAAIACEVYKRTGKPIIGLSLPTSTNEDEEVSTADLVGAEFCTEFYKKNITLNYNNVLSVCKDVCADRTTVANGNIKARLRMLMLYDVASIRRGIVLDTDNISEHMLGFWTLKGDESDLSIIGRFWKHEVYDFAKWIKENIYPESLALDKSIALIPTDGNGVEAGGDMGQIVPGHTYNDVDDILSTFIDYIKPYWSVISSGKTQELERDAMKAYKKLQVLNDKYGADTVERVIRRHRNSEFKRWHRPLVIDPITSEILQNNLTKLS